MTEPPTPAPDGEHDPADPAPAGAGLPFIRTMVGSRQGSPTVVVGFPFSNLRVSETDLGLRAALSQLAGLVAELADLTGTLAAEAAEDGDDGPTARDAASLARRTRDLRNQLDLDGTDRD